MDEFVKTVQAEQALQMCNTVLEGKQYHQIGQITGKPGTGKSALTNWLAQQMGAVRVECWMDMGDKILLTEIAEGLNERGHGIEIGGTAPTLQHRIKSATKAHFAKTGRSELIIIDEANQLKWATLEKVRALSDIGRTGLILCGTDILAKRLVEARVQVYLTQLRQRIGAKKVLMQPIRSDEEMAAYVVTPRFGVVTKGVAKRFRLLSKGHWRSALELADACNRLMKNEGIDALDERVVETAAAWMAGAD